ncbi:tumor necrosis factor receptor superfamily member 10B [Sigmodon hispidus]
MPQRILRKLSVLQQEGSCWFQKMTAHLIDALEHIFSFCSNNVPCNSWDTFIRKMGLTDNEIKLVRDGTPPNVEKVLSPPNVEKVLSPPNVEKVLSPPKVENVLYHMLVKWLNQRCINTLLDALEAMGEKFVRDTIEDYAVKSGMFIYQEAMEPAGQVTHASDSITEETEPEGSP